MKRFTDQQAQAFFDFVNGMEEKRYANGYGQTEHARLAFALEADGGKAVGCVTLDDGPNHTAADAVRLMLGEGFEAAAVVREGCVGLAENPIRLEALVIEMHRPDAQTAMWAREIITDKRGRRSLGDVVLNTMEDPSARVDVREFRESGSPDPVDQA